ncbi:hypothetical protein [Thalassobellus citreus]|uniref:hypothetical protein n=1 Tax=Thalassobellus citreus TaxID=3367752 RepID=UPI0037B973A5
MKKKLQLLAVAATLLLSFNAKADTIKNSKLNLNNPDVRKCLLEASETDGWKLASVYLNDDNKIVMIFDKDNDTKVYTSKEVLSL